MSTYQKCPESVKQMAAEILAQFDTHKPLVEQGVTIDLLFAFGERDPAGNVISPAIMHHGRSAGGLCRKVSLKDRAKGLADAEIILDGDNWNEMIEPEQRALLDHELHHLAIKIDKRGVVKDDLGRPVLQLRRHDAEYGWFTVIAARHWDASQERIQARQLMGEFGQYFWPEIAGGILPTDQNTSLTFKTAGREVTVTAQQAKKIVGKLKGKLAKR